MRACRWSVEVFYGALHVPANRRGMTMLLPRAKPSELESNCHPEKLCSSAQKGMQKLAKRMRYRKGKAQVCVVRVCAACMRGKVVAGACAKGVRACTKGKMQAMCVCVQ